MPYDITQVDVPGVLGGVQRMEHNALAVRAAQEEMAARAAARQRQSALSSALPSALSGDKRAMEQVAQLDPEMFMKLDDRQRAQAKERTETLASMLFAAKSNPQNYPAIREQAINALGLDPTKIPEQYDEGFIDAQAAQVLDVAKMLDMMKPQSDIGKINQDVNRGFVTPEQRDQKLGGDRWEPVYDSQGNPIAQRNVRTGKIESDPRATDNTTRKPPTGYRYKLDGSLEAIPGGPADPKTQGSGLSKTAEANAKQKLVSIDAIRGQIKRLKEARDNLSGVSTGIVGQGYLPTESGRAFDAEIAQLQSMIRGLTRTPGEGQMSDYESRLAAGILPSRKEYDSVIDQKIQGLEDLVNAIEVGYKNMLNPNGTTNDGGGKKDPLGIR